MATDRASSVLIVEDERIVAMDLQQTLRELGYDTSAIASSADDAVNSATEHRPDLVLMDIRINGTRDGIETAAMLKARFDVPIVYLTAHADEGTLDRAKRTEPHGYLIKPVNPAELRSVLEVSLHKHRSEVRLRERERWFATTLNSIAEGVVTIDLSGRVTFVNAAAEALIGISASEAAGLPVEEVLLLQNSRRDDVEPPILVALRSGKALRPAEGVLTNVTSGTTRTVADSAAPVVDQHQNRLLGAVMVFRDVTDERELQRQLERAGRLASLGTMSAGLAHEVSNPLTVILGNSEFIDAELLDLRADARRCGASAASFEQRCEIIAAALHDVQSAAGRIDRIVSDVRTFARPAEPLRGQIEVVRCVDWALRSTAHEFRGRARVERRLDPVPPVEGDESKLAQVLINLLMNAAHAMPAGSSADYAVTVSTRVDDDGRVVVEVRDTGVGIPAEALGRVFEPFYTTKPPGEGTGLGLSISHGIVAAMGGELQIESTLGQGTVVRARLAAVVPRAEEAGPVQAGPAAAGRARVLLVDDEPSVLAVLKRVLKPHDVRCVASASEALALVYVGHVFDVIVTDLTMPGISGIGLYDELSRHRPDLARRVVFLSGGTSRVDIREFLLGLPNVWISKPVEGRRLRDTIQAVLAREGPLLPVP